jgi:hypothetical protein
MFWNIHRAITAGKIGSELGCFSHGGSKTLKMACATIEGFEVRRALRRGQAASFNITRDIRGEARIVERAFGLGVSAMGLPRKWWDHAAMANAASGRLMISVLARPADVGRDLIRARTPGGRSKSGNGPIVMLLLTTGPLITADRLGCKLPIVVPFQPTDELRAVRWPGFRAWTSCLRVGILIARSSSCA